MSTVHVPKMWITFQDMFLIMHRGCPRESAPWRTVRITDVAFHLSRMNSVSSTSLLEEDTAIIRKSFIFNGRTEDVAILREHAAIGNG